jgi:hypothetical protein
MRYVVTIYWTDKCGIDRMFNKTWRSIDAAKWSVGEFQKFNPGCYRKHSIIELQPQ